ncbi:hypothetical protein ACHAWX_004001 [Stephanocyclus meneghinianus]
MDHSPEGFSSHSNENTLETKSRFRRRNSMTAPVDHKGGTHPPEDPAPSPDKQNGLPSRKPTEREPPEIVTPPAAMGVSARLCGPSRSKCGYCGGSRLQVLEVDDGFNKVIPILRHHHTPGKDDGGNGQAIGENNQNTSGVKMVDQESTSKSYGLLFDYLTYDTYQQLIDRGWRRSGKHLYRPHNFESCCPAISIRLDTTKFSSYYANSIHSNANEIEKSVLVGGTKSQRRVGRNLLRALQSYNAKYTRTTLQPNQCTLSNGTDDLVHSPGSTYASRVAKMKLAPDATDGPARSDELAADTKRKSKKSRQDSPTREDECPTRRSIAQRATATRRDGATTTFVTDRQVLGAMEEYERDLLRKLARMTYQTITERVIEVMETHDNNGTDVYSEKRPPWAWWRDDGSLDDSNIPKWCLFKFSPANQANNKQANTPPNALVLASTMACAAASGRSRGLVDRDALAAAVIDSMKRRIANELSEHSNLEFYDATFNEKSGQIQVNFALPPNYIAEISLLCSSSCSASEKAENKSATVQANVSLDEPFTEFLLRYQSDKCSSHHNDHFSRMKESSMSPPGSHQHQLFLVVRSVPVFESSIQPEVHQLFCRYQSSIHGDDNPYLCSEDNNTAGDGNEEYRYYLRHKSAGFLDIDATYSQLNASQRSKIKKSYLSFYRFLCETPLRHETLDSSGANGKDNDFILEDGYDINITRGGTYHQQYRLCTSKDAFDGPLIAVGVVGKFAPPPRTVELCFVD